jgi:RNA polymerase sigma factor (sigma-70 family)
VTWAELIDRLEADLLVRQGNPGVTDEKAWGMAADLLHRRGRLLMTRLNLNSAEMEDAAQEVLLKLQSLATMQRVRAAGSPEGYLVVMIRNAAMDRLRLRRRTIERDLLINMPENEIVSAEPETATPQSDETLRLKRVLRSLGDDERELLHMRFWQNMNFQAIAEALQISYSAAAVRMFRLLKRMEKLMTEFISLVF